MNLAPLPPLNMAVFSSPGSWSQQWTQYLTSLDAMVRTTVGGALMAPLPRNDGAAVNPQTNSPTQPWRAYWNGLDAALRSSGWKDQGAEAQQVLSPLPPTVGFAMANLTSGVLAQPWASYVKGADMLARAQTR